MMDFLRVRFSYIQFFMEKRTYTFLIHLTATMLLSAFLHTSALAQQGEDIRGYNYVDGKNPNPKVIARKFKQWQIQFSKFALNKGITKATLKKFFFPLTYNPKTISLDRRRPQFLKTFSQFIKTRLSQQRVEDGRVNYASHKNFLTKISQKYAVQPRFLVALWGMETNYGSYVGNSHIMRGIATLAFYGRRRELFQQQLVSALRILQKGKVVAEKYIGAWDGGYGQVQFMPTTFEYYAVDADGDGRIDLLNSKLDIFSSASNYLKKVGWEANQTWGQEVTIPCKNFTWSLVDLRIKKSLAQWDALCVRDRKGKPLNTKAYMGKAALVAPQGIKGPKFLVYKNFFTLLKWNASTYYALSVGLLSDANVYGPTMVWQPQGEEKPLSREELVEIQNLLKRQGYVAVKATGQLDRPTKNAIKALQKKYMLIVSGQPDRNILRHLRGKK